MAQKYDEGNFILLYRELMDKPIWADSSPEQKTILITLLLMARFKPEKRMFGTEMIVVERGQFITGLQKITNKCGKGVTIRNVRTALNKFKKYEFLTYETTNKGMLVTIENWTSYQPPSKQGDKQTGTQTTQDRQASDKQVTSKRQATDNYKEGNKEKEGEEGKKEKNINTKNSSSAVPTDKPLKFANEHSSIQFQLAALLGQRMKENNPSCKLPAVNSKSLDTWCIEIDKMIRLDKRDPEEIKEVIEWCQKDDFWLANILSTKKLRAKYDQLVVKKNQNPANKLRTSLQSDAMQRFLKGENV